MTKQAQPPPPGDKPSSPAPPPPPAWRHWLWPIAILATLVIWTALSATRSAQQVDLTYSQFITDVNAHKVKTFDIQESTGQATGTLTDGHTYNTVVPVQLAGSSLLNSLQANNVQVERVDARAVARVHDPLLADLAVAVHRARLAVAAAVPRRDGPAAGHHGRRAVAGEGVRRRAAQDEIL